MRSVVVLSRFGNQAPTICDIIALNLLHSRSIYQKAKFEPIAEERAKLAARRATRVPKTGAEENGEGNVTEKTVEGKRRKRKNKKQVDHVDQSVPSANKGKIDESRATIVESLNELPAIDDSDSIDVTA